MSEKKSALIVKFDEQTLATIEQIAEEVNFGSLAGVGPSGGLGSVRQAFKMAAAINQLREAITPEMVRELQKLQGSPLGFKTDKDQDEKGYDDRTVKECAIEVLIRGGHLVGNEFNIIAFNAYLTKNFFARKVREFPGLTNLRLMPGVPVQHGEKGALVPFVATWMLNGKADMIERRVTKTETGDIDERISVRVNKGMGPDAVIGKAERKILAAIYKRLTGSEIIDGEVDEIMPTAPRLGPASSLGALTQQLQTGEKAFDGEDSEPATAPDEPTKEPAKETAKPGVDPFIQKAGEAFKACKTPIELANANIKLEQEGIPEEHRGAVNLMMQEARGRIANAANAGKLNLQG